MNATKCFFACLMARLLKFLFAATGFFRLHWRKFFTVNAVMIEVSNLTKRYAGRTAVDGHFVHGRARRNRRPARPERRGQEHDDAGAVGLHAGDERHGARGGLRCVSRIGRGAPAHRLHAGKQSALPGNARAGIPEIPRAAQRPRLATFTRARHHGDGTMRPGGRGPPHHRPAFQGLPPARRPGGCAGA